MIEKIATRIFDALAGAGVPRIHFGTGTAGLLEQLAAAGPDLVSVDWRVPLDAAWTRIGHDKGIVSSGLPGSAVRSTSTRGTERETRPTLDAIERFLRLALG